MYLPWRRQLLKIVSMITRASWIYLIFFVSGMAGLIYQVIWVREFGQVFGNTVSSASIVTGLFVFGLGVGAYFAGVLVDRDHVSHLNVGLKYYFFAELGIAVLGLIISVLIPQVEVVSHLISAYQESGNLWMHLTIGSFFYRGLIVFVLLTPITVLMGATLTFLIRFLIASSLTHAGWKIGWLYGLNTLGAAFGCLLVDMWAIPHFGLIATKMIAVTLNLLAALAAGVLLKNLKTETLSNPFEVTEPFDSGRFWPAGLAIAISGFCAMGMEIVWFRFISSLYSSRRGAFSMTLVVMLVGMWLGAVLGGYLSKKFKVPSILFIFGQIFFVLTAVGGFFFFINTNRVFLVQELHYIIPLVKIIFVPSVAMGMAYPLINALVQKNSRRVGGRAGGIYLWNSFGALLGSLLTGFMLLPAFGMQMATFILCCLGLVATVPVLVYYMDLRFKSLALVGILFSAVALFYWNELPDQWLVKNAYIHIPIETADKTILQISEGINETAMVLESKSDRSRFLYTNGHSMSGTEYPSQRYMRAFAHIPLLQIEKPEAALVICFGVGNTTHAVALHSDVKKIDVVDISENVLGLAGYFESANAQVLKDPRVRVYVNDGREHLRMQGDLTYDLITLEPPPLVSAGVASLYSKEFYELAEQKLKSGGYLTQWLPIYQIDGAHSRKLIKSFIAVFPNAVLLNGFGRELILMGQKGGANQIDWKRLQTTIDARPSVKTDLQRIDLSIPTEILGMFMASGASLARNLQNVSAMTDNLPVIEYSHYIVLTDLPWELFEAKTFADWCPSCFENGLLSSTINLTGSYLSLMQAVYSSQSYYQIAQISERIPGIRMPFGGPHPVETKETMIHPIERRTYNQLINSYGALRKMFGPALVKE